MHSLRFACLVLGMWLAGGFFMAWVATENFHSADRLMSANDPASLVRLNAFGPGEGRALVRHQVGEENRDLFESWEWAQLLLGTFFFMFLLLGTREGKAPLALAGLMLLLLLPQRFWLTPTLTVLGRSMDFAPGGGSPSEHARFLVLHGSYVGLELLKWAAGILLGLMLIIRSNKRSVSGNVRKQVNPVNKSDHGHVDR